MVCLCVFCLFTPFPFVLFLFHGKNLLLLSLLNRYNTESDQQTSTRQCFLKSKYIFESNFLILFFKSFIQCYAHSWCGHIIGGVSIYLYECVSLLVRACVVCLCLRVCVISNQTTSKKPHYVSDLSKVDILLHKQGPSVTKVPRLDMCKSTTSLSKITHIKCAAITIQSKK